MKTTCRTLCLLLLLVLSGLTTIAFAADLPKDPILRLNAGPHNATIKRVDTDAAGRYAVTASLDKTVRVWSTKSGELLKTLRAPIGNGNVGKLFAVAISPDGSLIACSGWNQDDDIYLFNRASGRLVKRITGLKNVIFHLDFSPDGRYLAATFGGGQGLRVFRTRDWKLVGEDTDYAGQSYSVHFAADNRIVTTSKDGYLRLYDLKKSELSLRHKVKAQHGKWPYTARFSPDLTMVAVSYQLDHKVSLLSAEDLSLLAEPNVDDIDGKESIEVLAWSADGHYLYAAGQASRKFDGKWIRFARRWADAGKGEYVDLDTGLFNTVLSIASLPDGGTIFGGAGPTLSLLDLDGTLRWTVDSPIADLRAQKKKFKLAVNGASVRFGFESFGKAPHRFNLEERSLLPDESAEGLLPPVVTAPGLEITGWDDSREPKVNETSLKLKKHEKARAIAIAPGGYGFALAADWTLYFFSRDGEKLWDVEALGTCWAVNISSDGRVVVAAYGDGTTRWYRTSDGQELLTLFPHADRKRWVLWTPSGYYDASPGGEELIGWHVNNGKEQTADFYPASRFRNTYYRPDVIDQVLETLDESEALQLANAASGRKRQEIAVASILPPVVTLLSHQNGSQVRDEQIDLRYSVRSPSGAKITGVKVLIDGRPVAGERGISLKKKESSDTRSVRVKIPKRDCEVSIIAETANTTSVPATVRLSWAGTKPQQQEFVAKPKLYVLAIGVSKYRDKELTLGFAAKDARDFVAALKKQEGGLYREVVTKALTDEGATSDNILDGLDWLETQTTARDVAMLFLAGHGVNDKNGTYNFLPYDVKLNRLRRTGLPFHDIKTTLAALAGKAILFVDTCHSGNVMGGRRAAPIDINGLVNELASAENGAVVFASSTGRQYSLEDPKWGNGAFTKALVEGLSGKADYTGKGKISINMLDLYLSERVKELTGGKQTPTTTKPSTIPDFPVAIKL